MDVATTTRVDPVAAEIASFRASTATPAWPTLDKQKVLTEIGNTVRDAYQVNQVNSPLCGPAVVVFELVRRNPLRYVQMCRALYETGRCATDSGVIQPGEACRKSAPQPELRQADWMLLAAMRDSANALFPVTNHSGGIAGISTPDELMGWSRAVLGMANVHYESTAVYGEFAAMRGAQKALDRGGVAFLLISASLVTGEKPAVRIPDHWVAHTGATAINYGTWWKHDSGSIKFDCYSWGKPRHISAGEGTFEDSLFGVVTAWP
jgi:hypothetical protein